MSGVSGAGGASWAGDAPLRELARQAGLRVGAAVALRPLREEARYREVLAREFDCVTCENVMKPMHIQPERGRFDFAPTEEIVAFAERHGIAVRGHTLVWHNQNPPWLTAGVADGGLAGAALEAVLREHISQVVRHYRGRVFAWDVVNEAVAPDGAGLRDTLWLRGLGPAYLEGAFHWAHAADPDARLFYNDYGADGLGSKSDAVYVLVKELKERGVPIHGVGLQMHVGIGPGKAPRPEELEANIARLAALGLDVHVTEMDVKLQTGAGTAEERLREQAAVYRRTLEACLRSGACSAFVLWGFTDRWSWIPRFTGQPDAPLLFDEEYAPKPAYHAVADGLRGGTAGQSE